MLGAILKKKCKIPAGLQDRLIEMDIPENLETRSLVGMFLHGGYVLMVRDTPEREMFLIPKNPVDDSLKS